MREIKFRAWDKGRIWDEVNIGTGKHPYYSVYDESTAVSHWEKTSLDVVLMQYTGLKDKNGVEIYEGDIIKGRLIEEQVPDNMWLTLSEKEKRRGYRLFVIEDIFEPYVTPMPDNIEVIGNVHENPELLKEDK